MLKNEVFGQSTWGGNLKNKKRSLFKWLAVIILLLVTFISFFKLAFASDGFWKGLDDSNYITVYVKLGDTTLQTMKVGYKSDTEYTRASFHTSQHPITVYKISGTSNSAINLSLASGTKYTKLTDADSAGNRYYERVMYDISFTLPAHYKISNIDHPYVTKYGSANLISISGVDSNTYYDSDKIVTLTNDLNLKNTGMLSCTSTDFNTANRGHTTITINLASEHNVQYDLQGGSFPTSLKNQSNVNDYKIIPNGIYSLQSTVSSERYIHVSNASYEKGQRPAIVIYRENTSKQSQWIFERYGNTQYYYIISTLNGLALNIDNNPGVNQKNLPLDLWGQQNGVSDFLWFISNEGDGKVSICNKSTSQCLEIKNSGTSDNTEIQQGTVDHSAKQQWKMILHEQNDYPTRLQYADYGLIINSVQPEKEHYDFVGWNTKADGSGVSYKSGDAYSDISGHSKPVTLYAIWSAHDFTISFDANGGTGTMPTLTKKGFENFTLPANTFTRNGYTFIGWSTERYPDKITYKDKANYENNLAKVTLYAQWQRKTAGFIQRPFQDADMFKKDTELVGGNGTPYNKDKTDSRMAHIDEDDSPGYFSNGRNK